MNQLTEIADRVTRADAAARLELLRSPQIIQRTKAVRHKGGGETQVNYGLVVERPEYEEPPEEPGRSYYTIRPISTAYEVWDDEKQYIINDIVAYPTIDDPSYKAIIQPPLGTPPTNETYWEKCEEIRIEYALGFESPARDLRDCITWFEVGEVIKYISRIVNETPRYYLDMGVFFTGEPEESTMRYNPESKHPQAVFR